MREALAHALRALRMDGEREDRLREVDHGLHLQVD
jgi:hypothetical protein